ncbi:CBS domain-containing protein [Zooshikella ganghwensis]|uniref:CBS domain-containing protein n=1 Tax=Zooshikella ganghwensis TaxID=202772 RepID=A0A4P9VJY2_9GAMM|nr:CBS domain-containing protein [Zooshikella ganghwensis]RDH43595.1 CBS domain-containing protein [Zooshikella ganghwensis]
MAKTAQSTATKQLPILVKDYMTAHHLPFTCGTPLKVVLDRLMRDHLSGLPVINEDKEVIGFVSEQDCIKQVLQSSYFCDQNAIVNDVMRTDVLTVSPKEDIINLAQQMIAHKPKVYPVVENNKLVGLITRTDILRALAENITHCVF